MVTRVLECKQIIMNAIWTLGFLFGTAFGDLNVHNSKACGEIECGYAYYCSDYEGICRPCSYICDPGHDQQIPMCNSSCQDYIHDLRYIRKDDPSFNLNKIADKVQRLEVLATIALIFSLVTFVCLVFTVTALVCYKKNKFNIFKLNSHKKKKKGKGADISRTDDIGQMNGLEISTIRLPGSNMQDIIHDAMQNNPRTPQTEYTNLTTFKNLHARDLDVECSSVYTNMSNRTEQTLPKRMPTEDSTLQYIYENPALAPSPILNKEGNGSGSS